MTQCGSTRLHPHPQENKCTDFFFPFEDHLKFGKGQVVENLSGERRTIKLSM